MAQVNGAQTVQVVPGRNIIVSADKGKTNKAELQWLTKTVLADTAMGHFPSARIRTRRQ